MRPSPYYNEIIAIAPISRNEEYLVVGGHIGIMAK